MADRDTRTEAAAAHYVTRCHESLTGRPPRYWVRCRCGWVGDDLPNGNIPIEHRAEVEHYLAAADADDKANGIVRIKLDDLAEIVADYVSGAGGADIPPHAIIPILREAVQP